MRAELWWTPWVTGVNCNGLMQTAKALKVVLSALRAQQFSTRQRQMLFPAGKKNTLKTTMKSWTAMFSGLDKKCAYGPRSRLYEDKMVLIFDKAVNHHGMNEKWKSPLRYRTALLIISSLHLIALTTCLALSSSTIWRHTGKILAHHAP